MTTAIAERSVDAVALPKEQVDLIRRTVANGATNDELALFLYDCQRRGIHPLDKLLHFTKRGGKYTPVTSIDFMRSQAAMTGEMAGSDEPVFLTDARNTPANAPHDNIVSATVTVYRLTQGQRFAYTATARWAEYCPDNAPMWRRMPHTMLGKCAEALALRKAFPQQLAGLYSREEMDQADAPTGYVVEAPATSAVASAAPAATSPANGRQQPSKPNGGDSDSRPSGAEMLEGAARPSGANTDEGPDLGVDLPAGAYRILRVEHGPAGSKAQIVFNRNVTEAGKDRLPTWKQQVADLASELCQQKEPCFIGLKKSASGNYRIEDLMRVPKDYALPDGEPKEYARCNDCGYLLAECDCGG